jgi:hypothetical protein
MGIIKSAPTEKHQDVEVVSISQFDAGKIVEHLTQCTSRVPDDLRGKSMFTIDPRLAPYFEQPSGFGDEVFKNFSSANDDMAEAGTCLALGRATACVMHLMRVLRGRTNGIGKNPGIRKAE